VVAFLGALGPDKGARRIERLAALSREQGHSVRFVVIGYLETRHEPWQSADARLTVHGRYARKDLPALIAHYRPRFACFPSDGPESFSYTLSEAWSAHLPALVPPIGALAERVAATGAGWIIDDDEWHDDARLLARIVELASARSDPAFDAARTVGLPGAAKMAAATADCYAGALRTATAAVAAADRR
jgi:glycosyltransferase involved in cell wall biosynthesis